MSTKTFKEKLDLLKKKHISSHPDALNTIFQWEEKLIRLNAKAEWLQHPNTRELLAIAVEQLNSINLVLKDTEDLTEADRVKYFQLKKAHIAYLSLLSSDPKSEMASIEKLIDYELKTEDYE